jgi:hypothetical protein
MMNRPASLVLNSLLFVLASCSTEPRDPFLEGVWGGDGMGLVASSTRVTVTLPCSITGNAWGPVSVDSEGHFEFQAAFRGFYADYYAHVAGTIVGLRMDVVFTIAQPQPPDYSQRLELTQGRAPELDDYICLAQR